MKTWAWISVLLLATGSLAACGDDTSSDDGDDDGEGGGGGSGGGVGTGTMTGTGTGTGTGTSTNTGTGTGTGTGGDCSSQPSMACISCCATENPAGNQEFNEFFLGGCACDAAAPCAAQCTEECSPTPPAMVTPACDTCLGGLASNPCVQTAINECAASPACAALLACAQSCPPA